MSDPTEDFFAALDGTDQDALGDIQGSLRFDLDDGGHWRVESLKGRLTVTHDDAPADCVVRAGKATFDAIVSGELNAMAALLRGLVEVEGRSLLLVAFQHSFPGRRQGQDDHPATGVTGEKP